MFIDGLAFHGYRSFGEALQRLGPFSKMNLFIGPNNSGKSSVLNIVKMFPDVIRAITATKLQMPYEPQDIHRKFGSNRHIFESGERFKFGVALRRDSERFAEVVDRYPHLRDPQIRMVFDRVVSALTNENLLWIEYESDNAGTGHCSVSFAEGIWRQDIASEAEWLSLARATSTANTQGLQVIPAIQLFLHTISPVTIRYPESVKTGAVRQLMAGDRNFAGGGILNQLLLRQSPGDTDFDLREEWKLINKFVSDVLGQNARLQVTADGKTLNVEFDGRPLRLSNLGTGYEQVIIIAAETTLSKDKIYCLEEPECNLHPHLQKHLMRYLIENTQNQYFISTHSAHIIDTPGAEIFHLRLKDKESFAERVTTDVQKSAVCAHLGYRASDLLQSNCVIWVEGPSDVIYLRHWLGAADPTLREGIHYTLMYYGGSNFGHLTGDDRDVNSETLNHEDFISLRRLNRWIGIVMDSDRNVSEEPLNSPVKERLIEEFNEGPGFAWVTAGREVENYISMDSLNTALKALHPRCQGSIANSPFDRAWHYLGQHGTEQEADKVLLAREIAKSPANLDVLDLRERLLSVVNFIRAANDAPALDRINS